jgi:ankyrin repeat protein
MASDQGNTKDMSTMDSTARAILLACFAFVMPASAELNLDMVETDEGVPLDAKPDLGVRVRAGGGQGGTPMHWMAFNGDEAGISRLIIAGADIDARLNTGGTPLHLAAYNGHVRVVRLLVEHGARVNVRTKAGVTPLDWARRNGHEEVAQLLIGHGAKGGEIARARPDQAPPVDARISTQEDPRPAVVRRRQVPLKYSLFLVPEDSLAVNKDLTENTRAPEQPALEEAYRIQLGAFSSAQRAQDAWTLYRRKYPGLLGSRRLILDRTSVKGKTIHRVQTGPMSRSDARGICARLKQAGQSCAVMTQGAS